MGKTLFYNANIVSSQEVFLGFVLVDGEVIAKVDCGQPSQQLLNGAKAVDLCGKYLLPGGIDAHTHFDLDMGFTRAADDFYTGSVAAAFGGTTTVIDHISSGPLGCKLSHMPTLYRQKIATPSIIDYGLHAAIQHVDKEIISQMQGLAEQGINSVKIYLTYGEKLNDQEMLQVFSRAKELGLVVCVHCENDAAINFLRKKYLANGCTQPRFHPLSRPSQVEAEAVMRTLMLAKLAGEAPVYIVHLSSFLGLSAARLAKNAGQRNIYLETCPQYLFLDDSLYSCDKEGLKYILSPPLRSLFDVQQLWNGICTDEFDTLATDHCPFFFETQKQRGANDFTQCPNGAPGVELRMALMFTKAMQNVISLPQMVRLCSTRPAQIFGIAHKKGDIKEGLHADFAVFEPSTQWTARKKYLHENVDYTPYEGIKLQGKVALTVSRGQTIVENGVLNAQKGRGQYLHRLVQVPPI